MRECRVPDIEMNADGVAPDSSVAVAKHLPVVGTEAAPSSPPPRRSEVRLWDPLQGLGFARKWAWALLAMNLLALQWSTITANVTAPSDWLPDFFQEYASARNHLEGRDLYADHRLTIPLYLGAPLAADRNVIWLNAHPPTSILLALPLAGLDFPTAFGLWAALSIVLAFLTAWLIISQLKLAVGAWSLIPAAAVAVVCYPLLEHLRQGQLNLVLAVLLTGAWAAERSGRPRLAGGLIGLAAAIKLFPAFLLAFFAYRRRWSVVISGLVVLVVLTDLTVLVFGPRVYLDYVRNVLPQIGWFRIAWNNASILGLFSKLFDPLPGHPHNLWWRTSPLWNSPALMWAGYLFVASAFVGVLGWVARKPGDLHERDRAYGLALVCMLLLNPVVWEHYFVLLLLPLCLIWVDLSEGGGAGPKAAFLAVVALLCAGPEQMFRLLGVEGQMAGPLQVFGVLEYQFYALIGLFALGTLGLRRGYREPGAIGGWPAWLLVASLSVLALLSVRTHITWEARGLFDWIGLDYAIYASTGVVISDLGWSRMYDVSAVTDQIRAYLPYYGPHADILKVGPMPYPAPFVLPFLALSRLGPLGGFAAWTALNAALAIVIVRGLVRGSDRDRIPVYVATLAFFPIPYALFLGQTTIVMAYGLYRCFRELEAGRDFRAGLWLVLPLAKPQLVVIITLAFLIKGRWRALAGLALAGLALAGSTAALVGGRGIGDYLEILKGFSGFRQVPQIVYPYDMINFRGILANLLPASVDERTGSALVLALSAATTLSLLHVWRGPWCPVSSRWPRQMLATLIVATLTSHHCHIHTASLLIVPALTILARGGRRDLLPALFAAGALAPTYIFCISGTPKYAGWCIVALMAAAYAAILAESAEGEPAREVPAPDPLGIPGAAAC